MSIICQQTGTISGSNSILCGKLLRIYDIRRNYGTIDVFIEGQISPQVGDNAFTIGNERIRITLISKNVAYGTADVQLTISTVEVPPPPVGEYTNTVKLYMRPWPWYSPGGAADYIVGKLGDINGYLINAFKSVIEYSYVRTDIYTEGENVIISVRLNRLQVMSLVDDLGQDIQIKSLVAPAVLLVAGSVSLAIGIVGLIFLYIFEDNLNEEEPPKSEPAPPEEQLPVVIKTKEEAYNRCVGQMPPNPTCADVEVYATCLDAVDIGMVGTLKAVYPNFKGFQDLYDKYYDIYTKTVADCDPSVPGKTPADKLKIIKNVQDQFTVDIKAKYSDLQDAYDSEQCWIPGPLNTCILTAKTGKGLLTIGGLLIGGYILYKVTKKGG